MSLGNQGTESLKVTIPYDVIVIVTLITSALSLGQLCGSATGKRHLNHFPSGSTYWQGSLICRVQHRGSTICNLHKIPTDRKKGVLWSSGLLINKINIKLQFKAMQVS